MRLRQRRLGSEAGGGEMSWGEPGVGGVEASWERWGRRREIREVGEGRGDGKSWGRGENMGGQVMRGENIGRGGGGEIGQG